MLIEKIQLPDTLTKNEALLENDEKVFEPSIQEEDNNVKDEPVQTFNESADFELAQTLKNAYHTPPPTEKDEELLYAFYIKYFVKTNIQNTNQDIT